MAGSNFAPSPALTMVASGIMKLVAAVMKIAGDGTGDTRWKVPGVLDWGNHDPQPVRGCDKDTTTLYASDRDIFLFLVDDTHAD